ncbi:MAG: ribosomal-protein-alanine N-acetyltransferase [Ruminococcaceae bacterium]|nr:ribosomal-protein-alanine N-acetyltransferase [Oscillospiraceae bacterium]
MREVCLLTHEHLDGVYEIELACFSEPWSRKSLELLCSDGGLGVVILDGERVVAYGGMTCVLDEGAVTNIAVLPEFRRQGMGRAIVKALKAEAQKRGISSVFLEVRESNATARELYLSEGFFECGKRKGFYRHPSEDAIQMVYKFD